jgi:Trypsin-like peptidase domain
MFENAIEEVSRFTRPMHTIIRNYNGLTSPASATFFFVNDRGVAITCKHVAQVILNADKINQNFSAFKQELSRIPKDGKFKTGLKGLELKYHYTPESTVQMKHNFMNSFDTISEITCHIHPTLDLAILEFKGFNNTFYQSHAFPEFSNFRHNPQTDDIEWTADGNQNSPIFPIDGIVTRFVAERETGITGIEMSTPGLRGQSGGPLFDTDGKVCGMQFATRHLHLGFDMKDHEIFMDGKKIKIANHPFLHVGVCVHVDRIKEFLHQHNIRFDEVD